MQQNLLKNLGAAVALGLGLATLPATGAGLLGERYVSGAFSYNFTESDAFDNGPGVTLVYNHPLNEKVDLGVGYSYRAWDASQPWRSDFSDQRLQLMATAFGPPELDRIWVRVGAGVGLVDNDADDNTGLSWLAMVGTEYLLGDKVALQPYVGWSGVRHDSETTTFSYGVNLAIDTGEKMAVTLGLEGDHHYNIALSIGLLARF